MGAIKLDAATETWTRVTATRGGLSVEVPASWQQATQQQRWASKTKASLIQVTRASLPPDADLASLQAAWAEVLRDIPKLKDVKAPAATEVEIDGRSMRDVNGDDIERYGDRVARLNLRHGGGRDIAPMAIPVGQLLVVGDARGNSRDGRYFGLIPVDLPYGKAKGVIYRRGEGLVWKTL